MEVLKQGQIFAGRYRVIRRLAEGGMGAVYVALQEATELEVALKVLWPHVLQRTEAASRFALEAKISARIKSDHIVQVFDAGFDQETQMPFLVMELLQGSALQNLVEQRGALPPSEVIEIVNQAARGLDKAHAYKEQNGQLAPVIHRDLKPDNLFVARRETGEPLVKILDYGIAKILSQSTSLSREIKGTPIFMAYEQAVGQPLSPQTDIWALGLIVYFTLTGHNYWRSTRSDNSDLNTLLTEIVALPIEPPSAREKECGPTVTLPAGFDGWFQRCVNRDPKARFASAGEAARELAAIFTTSKRPQASMSPASLPFDSTLNPSSYGATRSSQLASDIAALGAHAGGTAPGTNPGTMNPASVTQSTIPMRRSNGLWVGIAAAVGLLGMAGFFILSRGEAPAQDLAASSATPEPTTQPSAAPQSVTGLLRIEPATAKVTVNGAPQSLADGKLRLAGSAGTAFTVEVTLGELKRTESVRLLGEGSVAPDAIVLPVPAPTSSPTVKVMPQPGVRVMPVAPARVVETKPIVAPKPAVEVKEAPPPSSPPKKQKFDPLAGPRIH